MEGVILKAREFAREAHKAQSRRYTGEPYFVHLEEVAGMVERAGLYRNEVAAAWLHDTIEDTPVTVTKLTAEFGVDIARMVAALTDTPPGPGINHERRKAQDRARLAVALWEVQTIKCADLISNTSSIVRHDPDFAKVYLPEKRSMLEVLNRAHPDLQAQAWASLRKAENDLLQTALQ
jgi:(p)ppGpp synthase/HD superfamily hydrolase